MYQVYHSKPGCPITLAIHWQWVVEFVIIELGLKKDKCYTIISCPECIFCVVLSTYTQHVTEILFVVCPAFFWGILRVCVACFRYILQVYSACLWDILRVHLACFWDILRVHWACFWEILYIDSECVWRILFEFLEFCLPSVNLVLW